MVKSTPCKAYGTRLLIDVSKGNNMLKDGTVVTDGGLALPEGTQLSPLVRGTIISCGPGALAPSGDWDNPQIKKGDEVLFERLRSFLVPQAGERIVCLWMSDVIAVFREDDFPRRDQLQSID